MVADPLATVRRLTTRAVVAARERDEAIRAARAAGASLRELSAASNLSHQTIANICSR